MHGPGRIGEEENGNQEVSGSQGGVREIEEAGASGVKAGRRDEYADQEQYPPDEVDHEEENSKVSQEANGPEVVGRDLECEC